MSSRSRRKILEFLDRALPGGQTKTPEVPEPGAGPHDFPSILDGLARELAAVNVSFHRASGMDDATEFVKHVVREREVKSAIFWDHPLLEFADIKTTLAGQGVDVCDSKAPAACLDAASADLGVTAVNAVIAQTGTLAVFAAKGRQRLVSLVPPTHLAVFTPDMLVPDISALPEKMRAAAGPDGKLPSAVHLITGPSSTADIEQIKVFGVHGPVAVYILLLDF